MGFREENKFLIYSVTMFGLYMYSFDTLVKNKCIRALLAVLTKCPVTLIPTYIALDFRSLFFDNLDTLQKFALCRKIVVYSGFGLKNIFFYMNRRKIEGLIDMWDDSFKEEFFPEKHLVNRQRNQKTNKKITVASIVLALTAALSYSFPSYFSKTKEIKHPTGLIYPHHSPGFELVVTFDIFVSCCCVSSALFDTLLMVFLSHVRAKLVFLRETLADIINEFIIDEEGKLLGRRLDPQITLPDGVLPLEPNMDVSTLYKAYEEKEVQGAASRENVAKMDSKLRIWILHHQQTIAFFDKLSQVYSSIASFELGYIVFYTAMTALNVVQMKLSFVAIGTLLVASSNLMSLFFWCKLSGELQWIDVFGDAFSRAWFLLPKKMKTAWSFIIMRSRKRLSLYGCILFAMNQATFFGILKMAYQSFAFLVQMSNEEAT